MLLGPGVFLRSGMDPHAPSFARAQAGARLVQVLLYLAALVQVQAERGFSAIVLAASALSAAVWGAQGWVPDTWRPWLYVAAVGLDVPVPLLAASGFGRRRAHPSHLPERLGLFTTSVENQHRTLAPCNACSITCLMQSCSLLLSSGVHRHLVGVDVVGIVPVERDYFDPALLPAATARPPEAIGVVGE